MTKQVRYISLVSLAVVALLLSFVGGAFAQTATGTITGTITDQKGLAMVGVNVQLHNVATGADLPPVTTNDQGVYNVPALQPGTYDVTVSQAGFSTVKRPAVPVQVGGVSRIDMEMPVSATQTLVTVTTEIPLLETEKTETSSNVSENLVNNIPLASRNWAQFALLTPGVNPAGTAGGLSFHGINGLYNNITVDGANNNYNYDGGARGGTGDGYTYSPDSIREFQVSSSGFGADTGQSAGGAVNTVTKSGTNMYHGDVFYNGRAARFNAIDPVAADSQIAKGATPTQDVHQQHQFGGSAGGPLWKDKLFFFTTFDGYRKVNPTTLTTSQTNPPIQSLNCPTLKTGAAAGTQLPTAAQCLAAKNFILDHYVGTFGRDLWQDIELVKIDAQINQSNHLTAVANIRDNRIRIDPSSFASNTGAFLQNRGFTSTWTSVIGANKVNELRYQYGIDNNFQSLNPNTGAPGVALTNIFTYGLQNGGSSWTKETRHQVSDNFSWTKGTHSMKFGFDYNDIVDDARSAQQSGGAYAYSTGLDMANVNCNAPAPGPGVTQAAANTQNFIFCNWLVDLYGLNIQDSKTGRHWQTYNQFFDMIYTGFPETFRYFIPNKDYGAFVNDTWKVRPNITFNWGVRYDLQQLPVLPYSPKRALAGLPPPALALPAGSFNLPIYDTFTDAYPSEHTSIQPRLGVAWNIRQNTVIRMSGGIFVAKTEGHNVKNAFSGAGETTTKCTLNASGANPSGDCLTVSGAIDGGVFRFPDVYFYQQNGGIQTPVPGAETPVVHGPTTLLPIPNTGFGIRGVDPTQRRPRVYTITTAIEQRLPGNLNFSASYVYTRGIRLPRGFDFNIGSDRFDENYCSNAAGGATPQVCGLAVTKTYDVVDSNGVTQTSVTVPLFARRAPIATAAGVVAVPEYNARVDSRTGVINGNSSTSYSRYNGLIFTLRKPMSHGIEVQGNYTWSVSRDSGQQGGGNSGEGQVGIASIDPFNDKSFGAYGYSGTDVRNRAAASVIYQPGFDKYTMSTVGKHLLGGWTMASSIIAQNGGHFTAQVSGANARSLTIAGYTPGSTTLAPAASGATGGFVYAGLDGGMSGTSISSPGAPAASRVAWLPSGSYVLPNLYNVDLRLEKAFTFKERYNIVIRGEAFNLLNSTQTQAVSTASHGYAASGAAGCPTTGITPHAGTVDCMVPVSSFQKATTTSGNNLRARELQAGVRFEF